VEVVLQLCKKWNVKKIVLGLPLNMDGSSGPAVEKVEKFARKLRENIDIEIEMWDERMSTMSAERVLIEGDMRRERRKKVIDKLAAQIILQNCLDAE
jgi:putative Holliday junction resolvase